MKIGKYKGFEFQEIPRQYGMWAAREVRMSPNPHVELARYAKWWKEREEKEHREHYGTEDTLEASATVPFPSETSSVVGSSRTAPWDVITDGGGYSAARDLPIDPKTNTLEEIRALETRLAVLKQKAKAKALMKPPAGEK